MRQYVPLPTPKSESCGARSLRIAQRWLGVAVLLASWVGCRQPSVAERASPKPSAVEVGPSAPASSAEPVATEPSVASAAPLARPPISNCAPQTAQEVLIDAHLRAKN